MEELTREEIHKKLTEWFDSGKLTTTSNIRMSAGEIERMSNRKELSYTPHPKLLFVGSSEESEDYKLFCSLFDNKRLLTPLNAKVHSGSRTIYELHKLAKKGKLMRFDYGGAIIYID